MEEKFMLIQFMNRAEQYTGHHLNNSGQYHCDMFAAQIFSEILDGCILAKTSKHETYKPLLQWQYHIRNHLFA